MRFDLERPSVAARMEQGDVLGVGWLAVGSPVIAEAAAHAGLDAVVIDLQHGLWTRASLEAVTGTLSPHLPVLARVASDHPRAICDALDAGVEGALVPMIETAEQGREALAAMQFAPVGTRSAGGCRTLLNLPDYIRWTRSHLLRGLMIETAAGLDAASDIAALDGLDVIFIGTGDLSLSMGVAPDDPKVITACLDVKDHCKTQGVSCAIFTSSVQDARAMKTLGFSMVVAASDISLVTTGFANAARAMNAPTPEKDK